MDSKKENAIKELTNIGIQIWSIIEQLKESDVAYYSSSEVASIISAIPNLEWGVGKNPKTGNGQFMAYIK